MRHAIATLSVLVSVTMAAAAQVHVVKTATETAPNPPLFVRNVQAPAGMRDVLVRTLDRCDWFTLVKQPTAGAYILDATAVSTVPPKLQVRVSTASGTTVANFEQATASTDPNWVVYKAVDALIQRLFQTPGLCASKIAFVSGRGRHKEILTCNFDGTASEQVTHNRSISTEPSWGPGAATLVYTLYGTSYTDVILTDLVHKRQKRLSQFPGLNAGADLSHDGRRAALCLSRDGRVDLYLMQTAGGGLRRVTNDVAVESSPTWSPDARTLCYVSDKARKPQLYLISVAGGSPVPLLAERVEAVSPDWSSVSNMVCFSVRQGQQYAVAVVDMKDPARRMKVLTPAEGDWEGPSWAPDGRHIVCARLRRGQRELYMLDSRRTRMVRITNPGHFALPNWSDLF